MGGAIARRLESAGHELALWNRTRSRAEALGVGRVASTPAGTVDGAGVVISILTDANAVRAAYLGDDGAIKVAKSKVFVEMSTAGPDIAKELAPLIEKAGGQFVEAPVLGSVGAVEAGTLIIFVAVARAQSSAPVRCSRILAKSAL
jgi:3-hydroxyisobutyrate dehydrogenase-like beta-hydroxyacid dehydrogenase